MSTGTALAVKRKTPGRQAGPMSTCCFYIQLKTGVVAIFTFWMFYSLVVTTASFVFAVTGSGKSTVFFQGPNTYMYLVAVLHLLTIFTSVYGIISIQFLGNAHLRILRYFSFLAIFLFTVANTMVIAVLATFSPHTTRFVLVTVFGVLFTIASIYFTFVIHAYVTRRLKLNTLYDPDVESIKEIRESYIRN